tara:strand:- start:41 stop:169 length:129 start_codon:yes stop_codon:yes gene_type:complete
MVQMVMALPLIPTEAMEEQILEAVEVEAAQIMEMVELVVQVS